MTADDRRALHSDLSARVSPSSSCSSLSLLPRCAPPCTIALARLSSHSSPPLTHSHPPVRLNASSAIDARNKPPLSQPLRISTSTVVLMVTNLRQRARNERRNTQSKTTINNRKYSNINSHSCSACVRVRASRLLHACIHAVLVIAVQSAKEI
jgi:hypothetical protein